MLPDAVDRSNDEGNDSGLDAQEECPERRRLNPARIQYREQKHENEPGRHEAESRKYAALPASGQHAEVDAEFVRFGPWECLINSEDPVEALPGDPLLLLHYLLTDHRDLGHWPAPRQQPETEEPKKKPAGTFSRNGPSFYPLVRGLSVHRVSPVPQTRGSAEGASDREPVDPH